MVYFLGLLVLSLFDFANGKPMLGCQSNVLLRLQLFLVVNLSEVAASFFPHHLGKVVDGSVDPVLPHLIPGGGGNVTGALKGEGGRVKKEAQDGSGQAEGSLEFGKHDVLSKKLFGDGRILLLLKMMERSGKVDEIAAAAEVVADRSRFGLE